MNLKRNRHGPGAIRILVEEADALEHKSDLLVLKCAQHLYGLDEQVAKRLRKVYPSMDSELPKPGDFLAYDTSMQLGAKNVIVLGVLPLRDFGYEQIHDFAKDALGIASLHFPNAGSIALTVHGPGYGLDEMECFESLITGLLDQLNAGSFPPALNRIILGKRTPASFSVRART